MNTNAFVNDATANAFSSDELEDKAWGYMQNFLRNKKVVEDYDGMQNGLGAVMFQALPQIEQERKTAEYEASRAYFESPEYEAGKNVVQEYRGICERSGKQPFVDYVQKKHTDEQRAARDKYDYLMGGIEAAEAADGRFDDARNAETMLSEGIKGLPEVEAKKLRSRSILRGMAADLKGWGQDEIENMEDQAFDEIARDHGEKYDGDHVSLLEKISGKIKKDASLNKAMNDLMEKSMFAGVSGKWEDVEQEAKLKMGDAYTPEVKAALRKNFLAARGQKDRVENNLKVLEGGIQEIVRRDDWTTGAKAIVNDEEYKAGSESILNMIDVLKKASPSEMYFYRKSLENKVDMGFINRAWTAANRGTASLFRDAATMGESVVAAIADDAGRWVNRIWDGADMDTGRVDRMAESMKDMELVRQLAYSSQPMYYDGDHGFKNGLIMAAESAPMAVVSIASGLMTAGQSTAAGVIGTGAKTGRIAQLGRMASNIVKTGTPLVPSYSGMHFREALANNPDGSALPMLQAATAAGLADAAIDGAGSLFGLKIGGFLGKTAAVQKGQIALWKKSPLVNGMFGALKTGAAELGSEFAQEQAQNFTNPAFQDLAGKLYKYDSKVDWKQVIDSVLSGENNEMLAWSLIPMAILAAAGGGVRHAAISEYYKGHVEEMKQHFGFTGQQVDTILMEPDVAKRAKMIEDTTAENLRLVFPANPVTADNTEDVGRLAEEMDMDPGTVLRDVNEFALEHGVPAEDVKVLRDESGSGYELEVMTDTERKERDERFTLLKKDEEQGVAETKTPSTEEADEAILIALEEKLQNLESMGYPMLREERGTGESRFYFDSPLTGERLEFGSRSEAMGVISQEWAAIEVDQFEKMKKSLVGETAERLNATPVQSGDFAMDLSLDEEMTMDTMRERGGIHAESIELRAKIAEDQEGKSVSGKSRVLGVSETRYNPERGITVALQKMYMGADPLDCYEEFSEGMVDVWINSGQLSTSEIVYEIRKVEKAAGLSVLNLEEAKTEEEWRARAKEAWSKLARGWIVGNIDDQRLGAKLLSWFRQMLLVFTEGMNFSKDIVRGAKLKHAKDKGKLDAEVMRLLDESVGIDWDAQAEKIRIDSLRAAKNDKGELSLVLAGRLPDPEIANAHGDPLAGLLADVREAAGSAHGKKRRGDVGEYMSKAYVEPAQIMEEINSQHGFDYNSPVQMLTDLANGLRFGMKQYGKPSLTQSVEGSFSGDGPRSYIGVDEVMTAWKNTLDGYLSNPPKPGSPDHSLDVAVCPTPAVLRMVGAKELDLVTTGGVIDKVMKGKHAISRAEMEKLPSALADPVCITVSNTPNSMEIITEMEESGHNVLVAVQLNSGSYKSPIIKVNRISSAYGKENIRELLNRPMLYWNKTKARSWMNNHRLQLPASIHPKADSKRKILKTEDLAKYKNDNQTSFSIEESDMSFLDGLKDPAEGEKIDTGITEASPRHDYSKYEKSTPRAVIVDLITKSSEEKVKYLEELKSRFEAELASRGFDKMGRYKNPLAARDAVGRIIDGVNIIDVMCQTLPGDAKKYLFGVSEERSRIMNVKTNIGRMNAFRRMVFKLDRAMDIMISRQKRQSVERMLKYAKPMITKSQITKGKMTAEAQEKINYIETVLSWGEDEWRAEAEKIDRELDWASSKDAEAPSEDFMEKLTWQKQFIDTFGGFYQRNSHGNYVFTATQMIKAFDTLKSVYMGGRDEAARKKETRGADIEKRRSGLLEGSKANIGRYSSGGALSEFNSKWATKAKNWGRGIFSFDQFMKSLFGLNNSEARKMEEEKYDSTDDFNKEEMTRQEEDMIFFKKIIAESLGNADEWKKVSDFSVAKRFTEWEELKEFDIHLEKFEVMKDVVTRDILEEAFGALEEKRDAPEWLNKETEKRAKELLEQFKSGDITDAFEFVWLKPIAKDPNKFRCSEFEICTLLNHELQGCYSDNLDAGGFSQEILRKLEENLSPEARRINDYFLEKYDESWESVNKVYKEMFNLDMAKIVNYSPASLEPKGGNDTPIEMNARDAMSLDKVGAIKTRVTNSAPVVTKSAWQLYNNHFTQMAYWKSHALYLRDVQAVLRHRDVKRFVETNYGSDSYGMLLSWIECFRCGGINRSKARNGFSEYVNRLSDVMAQGFLSWNPKTMLRQFPAVAASSMDVDIDFMKGVLFALSKKNKTDPALKDYLKQRVRFGVTPEMKRFEDRNKMKPSRIKQFTREGNEMLGRVDKFFTSFSGRVAYGYYDFKAREAGLSGEEAEAYASRRAVHTMRRTAQPVEAENKSLWENYADGLHKLAFLFKSEPRKNFASAMFAVSLWMNNEISLGKATQKASAAALLPGFLNPLMMVNFISAASSAAYYGNMDDPEDVEDIVSYLRSGLMDSVTGIPLLGDAIDYAVVRLMNEGFGTNLYSNAGIKYLPFQDIGKGLESGKNLVLFESDDPWKDSVKFARAASLVCAFTGWGTDIGGSSVMATRTAGQGKDIGVWVGECFASDPDQDIKDRMDRLGRVAGRNARIESAKKKESIKDAGKAYEISPKAFIEALKGGRLNRNDAKSIVQRKQKDKAPDYLKQFLRLSKNDRRKALMGLPEDERKKVIELLKKENVSL